VRPPGRYCSRDCQKLHWSDHKASCIDPARRVSTFVGFEADGSPIAVSTIIRQFPDGSFDFLCDVDG
jgi:hypothetical protein